MWPFSKKKAAQADAPKAEGMRRGLRGVQDSPMLLKADAELIRDVLPRIFQRTGDAFAPDVPENGTAMSMDAALDSCGHSRLPDIFSVQDTVPGVLFSWYGAQSFIGYQACAILAQHWFIAKACGQAPKDAMQNGFKPVASLPEGDVPADVIKAITERDREMNILNECYEACRNARIFGIRHVLFLVDGIDYEAPFNPDGVAPGSYRGISQIDPYWLTPVFDAAGIADPAGAHFYEPTWWRLPNGQKVHRSHFVILREDEVPDVLKPTYYYGGIPLPQKIYERVYCAERTANEAPELALTKRLITLTASLENYLTDENEITERLHAFNRLRSNFGFLVVGEDENINQIDTALTDFDALIMTQYQIACSIAGYPSTELLGTSPKGFNATGEHESNSYDQALVSMQTNGATPIVDRHHLLLCRSEFSEHQELSIETVWNPVRAPKPGELADINLKKAQAAHARVTSGVTTGAEEREALVTDPDSGFGHLGQTDGGEESWEFEDLFNHVELDAPEEPQPAVASMEESGKTAQEISLNGAQVSSMLEVVSQVAGGFLPRSTGVEILLAAFPVSRTQAENIMGAVGKGFTPANPDSGEGGNI